MSTFNNIAVRNTLNDNTSEQFDCIADVGLLMPKLSKRDRRKCKVFLSAIKSAINAAEHHLANTRHTVTSRRDGFSAIDRLGSLCNAIAKFDKLNAGALDGGMALKLGLIETAWLAYAKLEKHGLDNAHYQATNIPCNVNGETVLPDDSENGFRQRWYKSELAREATSSP